MIKTQKTRIAALLLVLVTLFTALFIPINAADAETDGNVGIEEIMPRRAYGCYNYTIYNSLQSCYGYPNAYEFISYDYYKYIIKLYESMGFESIKGTDLYCIMSKNLI